MGNCPFGRYVRAIQWANAHPGRALEILGSAIQACKATGTLRDTGASASTYGKSLGSVAGPILDRIPPGLIYGVIYEHLAERIEEDELERLLDEPTEFHIWETEEEAEAREADARLEKELRAQTLLGMKG